MRGESWSSTTCTLTAVRNVAVSAAQSSVGMPEPVRRYIAAPLRNSELTGYNYTMQAASGPLDMAIERFDAHDYIHAEALCREALKARPGDPAALHILGRIC